MRASVVAVIAAVAVAIGGCGGEDETASPRVFEEEDLAEIVRGVGRNRPLVADETGPQTLAELAEEIALDTASIDRCGFVAASEAMFEGSSALPLVASARLFDSAEGASCYLELLRASLAADDDPDAKPLDATSFGPGAIGYSVTLSEFFELVGYFWSVGNLVLEVAAPPDDARAFAEDLDERANDRG